MRKLIALAFIIVAYTSSAATFFVSDGASTYQAVTALDAGRQSAVTLPTSLADDTMYMAWAEDPVYGFGRPVAINKTEAWWVGPDVVAPSESFSVYGRNLELGGDGLTKLWIDGYNPNDGWIDPISLNPYRAEFTVPADLPVGTYDIYIHNGHGKEYGWADKLTITIRSPVVWNGPTINVTDSQYAGGADITGATSSEDAIEAAFQAADNTPFSKVYFPNGNYSLGTSSGNIKIYKMDDVYVYGESRDGVVIQPMAGYSSDSDALLDDEYVNVVISNLTLRSNQYGGKRLIRQSSGSVDLTITDCFLSQYNASVAPTSGDNIIELTGGTRFTIKNCVLEIAESLSLEWGATQFFFHDNEVVGCHNANTLLSISRDNGESEGVSIYDNVVRHYNALAPEDSLTDFCKGRWIHGNHGWRNFYASGNQTIDLTKGIGYYDWSVSTPYTVDRVVKYTDGNTYKCTQAHTGQAPFDGSSYWDLYSIDENEGEHYMYEFAVTYFAMSPSAVNGAELTFASLPNYSSNPAWSSVTAYVAGDRVVSPVDGDSYKAKYSNTDREPSASRGSWDKDFERDLVAVIQDGRGLGQHRIVVDLDSANKIVTLDRPFDVAPDTSSIIAIGAYAKNVVIYDNIIDGRSVYVDVPEFHADYALLAYGGVGNLIFDKNAISDIRFGATIQSRHSSTTKYDGSTQYLTQPHFFSYIGSNTLNNTRYALSTVTARRNNGNLSVPYYFPNTLGNVFRGNVVDDAYNGVRFGGTYSAAYNEDEHIDMHVWQDNSFANISDTVETYFYQTSDLSKKEEIDDFEVYNNIFTDNSVDGSPWAGP